MTNHASHTRHNDGGYTTPCAHQAAARLSAECGSIQLLDKLELAIANHARKHRYTFEVSRLLCANSTERMG